MTTLALVIFAILALTAVIHIYWGFGGLWPAKSEAMLVKTVVGIDHPKMPGPWLTLLVAAMIFAAGVTPLVFRQLILLPVPEWLTFSAMICLALVFLARGAAGYIPAIQRLHAVEPFRRLNQRYFSPLCLILGVGYVTLLLS